MEASFYLIAYCCALRGEEGPSVNLYGIAVHWADGETHRLKHVVVALLGRFKGEIGKNYHLMPVLDVKSGTLNPENGLGAS